MAKNTSKGCTLNMSITSVICHKSVVRFENGGQTLKLMGDDLERFAFKSSRHFYTFNSGHYSKRSNFVSQTRSPYVPYRKKSIQSFLVPTKCLLIRKLIHNKIPIRWKKSRRTLFRRLSFQRRNKQRRFQSLDRLSIWQTGLRQSYTRDSDPMNRRPSVCSRNW